MSPLCPSEYLIRAHHSRRRAEGALARSSPPAAPRALCGCLAWDLTDAAHVPLGRDGNFNSAPPSAHVSFLTSGPWGRKKKKEQTCQVCFLLSPCLCFTSVGDAGGAGAESGRNDSSVKA